MNQYHVNVRKESGEVVLIPFKKHDHESAIIYVLRSFGYEKTIRILWEVNTKFIVIFQKSGIV